MSKPAETAGTAGSGRTTTPSSPAAESAAPSAPANGHVKFGRIDAALEDVEQAIVRAREGLLSRQHEEGYWNGELEADAMLEADYIFLHVLLGTGDHGKMRRGLTEIFRFRKDDGSWSLYPGGPGNISLTVKCYFAAKLMGIAGSEPHMVQTREWILAHGGVTSCNTFTKIYLCSLGQYEYNSVPAIPPEIVLFPNWYWFNIYEISSWSRAILVPLSIAYAKKPFKKIAPEQGISELFVGGREHADLKLQWDKSKFFNWALFL